MIFDRVFRGLIALLLLAAIYLFFTLIQSVDRARAEALNLQKKLSAPAAVSKKNLSEKRSGVFANAGYFSPNAVSGGSLSTVLSADPPGLNPLLANEASASAIFSLCSMTLAERDWAHPERFRPLLAESFSISPDRKSYK